MRALSAKVVQGDGVRQGLHTRLQTEGNFGVTDRVSARCQDGSGGENRLQNDKAGYKRAQSWQQLLHAEESIVPLSIHGAQRNTPQLRAELSQLRDEISHLIRP